MSVAIRHCRLSGSADELLLELAAKERGMHPDVFASLVLEMAIRERHENERRLAAALACVDGSLAKAATR